MPKLIVEKCTGCGECETICPQNAIVMTWGKPVVDNALCVKCGTCVDACPENALQGAKAQSE